MEFPLKTRMLHVLQTKNSPYKGRTALIFPDQRLENPCVGGSIPPRATKLQENANLRVGVFRFCANIRWLIRACFSSGPHPTHVACSKLISCRHSLQQLRQSWHRRQEAVQRARSRLTILAYLLVQALELSTWQAV
jgi:hypothetical protein